jgi:Gene product 70
LTTPTIAPNGAEILIAVPCWLYVTKPSPDTVAVYRSTWLRDSSPRMNPVHELIGGAEVIDRTTVDDDDMVFRKAEYTLYAIRPTQALPKVA